jgi:hypothetical protein
LSALFFTLILSALSSARFTALTLICFGHRSDPLFSPLLYAQDASDVAETSD